MFEYNEQSLRGIEFHTGGVLQANFSDVYEAQRKADILGGQSYSEVDGIDTELQRQLEQIRVLTGQEQKPVSKQFIAERVSGYEPDPVRQAVPELLEQDQKFLSVDEYNKLVQDMRVRFPEYDFKTFAEAQNLVAVNAREAYNKSQDVSARASGSADLFGGLAAGAVAGITEPANIAAMLVTLPVGLETMAGSLMLRLGKMALLEGAVGAASEGAIQADLIDFYKRQGFTDKEIRKRVTEMVIGAGVGGAALSPAFSLAGIGIGKAIRALSKESSQEANDLSSAAKKLMSEDPAIAESGLMELKAKADKLNLPAEALDEIDQMLLSVRILKSLPEDVRNDPVKYREALANLEEFERIIKEGAEPSPDLVAGLRTELRPDLTPEPGTNVRAIEANGKISETVILGSNPHAVIDDVAIAKGTSPELSPNVMAERVLRAENELRSLMAIAPDDEFIVRLGTAKSQTDLLSMIRERAAGLTENPERLTNQVLRELGFVGRRGVFQEATLKDANQFAREIAPDVIKKQDELNSKMETLRRWLQELQEGKESKAISDIDAKIADTETKLQTATGKRAATYRTRLEKLTEERAGLLSKTQGDNKDMAKVRQQLQEVDQQLRDLAPEISEVYRRANDLVADQDTLQQIAPTERFVEVEIASPEPIVGRNSDASFTRPVDAIQPVTDTVELTRRVNNGEFNDTLQKESLDFVEKLEREGTNPELVALLRSELNDADAVVQELEAVLKCIKGA